MTTKQRLSRHAELGGYDGLRARSIPGHEYNNETTGTQRQVVCSCRWRSKVWSRDNEHPIDDQWLSHVASKVAHKVVVTREASMDDTGVEATWLLLKQRSDEWVPCRRDDPADDAAFLSASHTNWLTKVTGEYELQVHEIQL